MKSKISKHIKKAPYIFPVLKELEASLRMGIYEDRQIHTKTGFRPIKLQESRSGPHTNRTPSNKGIYCLTKISIRAKCSISHVFSLFIVPSPFLYIARTIFLLTGLRIYMGEYKAQGPTLCPTEGRALRGPRALYLPV